MNAILLAGGEGKRLRPLTCTIPIPLLPVCGKPCASYLLDQLADWEASLEETLSVVVAAGKWQRQWEAYYGEEYRGLSLSYLPEPMPMGTAGAARAAANGKPALVLYADMLGTLDASAALSFHEQRHAAVTLLTQRTPDPRGRLLAEAASSGRVVQLQNCPSYEECRGDLASCGGFLLSKEAAALLPGGKERCSMEEALTVLLGQGLPIYSFETRGYWRKLDSIPAYRQAQEEILNGRPGMETPGHRSLDGLIQSSAGSYPGARIVPPCYIGPKVTIQPGAVVEAGSVLCEGVVVEAGAKVRGAVAMEGAYLGPHSSCVGAVLGPGARLLADSSAFEDSVLAERACAEAHSIVEAGVRLWPGKRVAAGHTAAFDVRYGRCPLLELDEDGLTGETGGEISPRVAALLGGAVSCLGEKIAVGYAGYAGGSGASAFSTGENAGKALAMAVQSGIMAAGAEAWDAGGCSEAELDFAIRSAGLDGGVWIEAGVTCRLRILSKGGLPLTRAQERAVENGLNRREFPAAGGFGFGDRIDFTNCGLLYLQRLEGLLPQSLPGIRAEVSCPDRRLAEWGERLLSGRRGAGGTQVIFHLSGDGRRLSAYSEETGYLFHEKLVLLCCQDYFDKKLTVSLPSLAPAMAEEMAAAYGGKVLRYGSCSSESPAGDAARRLARQQPFPRDGLELMCRVLESLNRRGCSLKEAARSLPAFTSASRYVPVEGAPGELMSRVRNIGASAREGCRVVIRPVKTGKGLMVYAESFRPEAETASELCDFYEKLLRSPEFLHSAGTGTPGQEEADGLRP